MSEMVERVARAMAQLVTEPGEHLGSRMVHCAVLARAAIAAMREPTDQQRNAYYELSHRTEVMIDAHWERAIDAALRD